MNYGVKYGKRNINKNGECMYCDKIVEVAILDEH